MRFELKAARIPRVGYVIGGDRDADADVGSSEETSLRPAFPFAIESSPDDDADHGEVATADTLREEAEKAGFEEGKKAGFDAGYRQGFEQGQAEGLQAGEQQLRERLLQERAQTQALLAALSQPLPTLKADLAEAITEGALHLARLLVGDALKCDTEAVTAVLSDILAEAVEVGGKHQVLRIYVPPAAEDVARSLAEPEGAEVVVDANLAVGDVRATLAKNNGDTAHQVEWDARLETRWEAIRKALRLNGA
ncbi:MAG TPA: FliH/SctL family protein [Gammaproteobacteria bacterium]|nr:FliH/SctL family protein [Gammaproteobacteria bacterium]